MREGWKRVKLGEIITLRRGLTYKKDDEVGFSEKIVLRSNNVNLLTHLFDYDELKYLRSDFDIPADKYIKQGELLMCMSNGSKAHLGKVALYDGEDDIYAFGGFMSAISHNDLIASKFLYYALITSRFKDYINTLSAGANINNLKTKDIDAYSIELPSLEEQHRIVELLDAEFAKIDAIKANAEKQLQWAKDLFHSALKDLLTPKDGWEMVSIGDKFKTYSGGTPLKSHKEYYENGKIPWINSGEVAKKYIYCCSNFISEEGLRNSSAKYFPFNTVLVAMYGATAAQAGILKFEATSNQAVCGLLPNKDFVPEFVYYWFLLNKEKFAAMAQGGAQPNLSQIKIKAMKIPLISLQEQEYISEILGQIESKIYLLEENFQETVYLCNDLKHSLLKDIFG